MANSNHQSLGPLVRLWGISTDQLPPLTASQSDLVPFVTAMLQEAVPFVDSIAPKDGSSPTNRGWTERASRTYAYSDAPVYVLERVVNPSELEKIIDQNHIARPKKLSTETWACRRSVHRDAAAQGTASWAEFYRCFEEQHCEAEDAFTPAVVASREAAHWDCGGLEVEVDGGRWVDIRMVLSEVRHKIAPVGTLRNRVFGELTLSAALEGADEFVIASVTVNDLDHSDLGHLVKEHGIVVGAYTSVERVRRLQPNPVENGSQARGSEIEWVMATTSDAKGVLPLWLQSKAVPGQVAKDVSMFMGWIARERKKMEGHKSEILKGL